MTTTTDSRSETTETRYVQERLLGKGGVGVVYLARDTQLERWVAIKRIHTETQAAAERAQAAISEAKHLACLQHPNIVTVFDFVDHGNEVMVVMEYIHGYTLDALEAPMNSDDFAEMAGQSLAGLEAAHSLGMVHRDIKPGNIMLAILNTGKFQVKVLDFGLAKVMEHPTLQTLDHTGALMGSIFTMAPEQFSHEPVDARTDLYALGCTFYHALTLQFPFQGDSLAAIMAAHLQEQFVSLHLLRPDLPQGLCAWVERLIALKPEDRPQNAAEAASELRQALIVPAHPRQSTPSLQIGKSATPEKAFPWLPVTAGVLLLGIVSLFAPGFFQSKPAQKKPDAAPSRPTEPTKAPAENALIFAASDRSQILASLGKTATVEGIVARIGESKSSSVRFLNFEGTTRGDFSLVFFLNTGNPDFSKASLEKLIGEKISVTGTVTQYQGNPQMEISDFSQIQRK